MATTTSLTTTYAGAAAGGYIMPAFKAAESLQYITVKENIPGKLKVQRINDNATSFAGQSCDFTPAGTVTLDEKTITLVDMSLQRNLCKKSFFQDWEALAAQNGDINTVADALILTMGAVIGQITENMIWKGTAGTGAFDGFETKMFADAAVIDATYAAITASNVVAKIAEVVGLMPIAVRRAPEKPIIYVASNVAEAYRNAQAALGNGFYFQSGEAINMKWIGQYDIAECPGMTDDTIVFAAKSNLWFGTNKESDLNNILVKDMSEFGEQNVRFVADFFGAVQYGWPAEIVFHSVLND